MRENRAAGAAGKRETVREAEKQRDRDRDEETNSFMNPETS